MRYIQIASGITCTFVFIELRSFVLGAGNVFVLLQKIMHIVSSATIINTEYIYTTVWFIFHMFWFPKIPQSIHFRFCLILDQHLILFFSYKEFYILMINSICRSFIILVSLFYSLASRLVQSSVAHPTSHSSFRRSHILVSTHDSWSLWWLS